MSFRAGASMAARVSPRLRRLLGDVVADSQRAPRRPRLRPAVGVCTVVLLVLFSQALRDGRRDGRHRRDVLDSTETPAEHIDPAAIDLTSLVNTLVNTSQSGSRQLFSLLSVTSYSSLALHKLTLLVYNISSIRSLESNKFRRRFCYCVTNETNDLTDFTAILLDVMGNSTSYFQELFKSASILSVSQRNHSDCIYICVMAGKTGREVPGLWEVGSITPLFNQTIVEGPHRVGNVSSFRLPVRWIELPSNGTQTSPSGMSSSRVHFTAHVSPAAPSEKEKTSDQQPATFTPRGQTTASTPQRATGEGAISQTITATPPTSTLRVTTASEAAALTQDGQSFTIHSRSSTNDSGSSTDHRWRSSYHNAHSTNHILATSTIERAPSITVLATSTIERAPSITVPTTSTIERAPSTTGTTQLATASTEPKSPVFSPTQLITSTHQKSTTTHRSSSTVRHTRPSPDLPSADAMVDGRTKGSPSRITTPSKSGATQKPGCPWRRPELTDTSSTSSTSTVSAHKLQPCVLELCKFFSQCLCRPSGHRTRMKRYCEDSHLWYEEHTLEVCRRVRRVSFSRNLKQRCLTKMCSKL
ncbi:HERV-H LTR-associating protein 1 [Pungitius pungitius]|uniref:HERV-H LTR-associating protein 1 n=1 Tax=Pungitius pungitius TaxID=134920 RepID=UPI002E10C92A